MNVASPAVPPLRPPGARDEATFVEHCVKCGGCIVACPYDAIVAAPPEAGPLAGMPELHPRTMPCYLCMVCPSVCPANALRSVAKVDVTMGVAVINETTCLAHQGEACQACVDACPFPGRALALDGDGFPRVDLDACVGCGICVHVCPTEGPGSIRIDTRRAPKRNPAPI